MPSLSDNPQAIKVSTYIGQDTRALHKQAFETGDVIGLYACQTSGNYANVFSAGFMNNVAVTKEETGWTYSPLAAWPSDNNEHLSFIAFYPRITDGTATTYPFTVNSDPEQQTDPLWCTIRDASINDRNGTAINGSETDAAFEAASGSLNLKFRHMLSNVRVYVKLANSYPGIDVFLDSLVLRSVYGSGTFTIANDLLTGRWSTSGDPTSYTLHYGADASQPVTTKAVQIGDDMMMIPQRASDGAYYYLEYTHTLAEGGNKRVSKSIYIPGTWELNKVYNYTISLSLDTDNITITAEVQDREDSDTSSNKLSVEQTPAEAVDLGLSVKWASYNVGASSPEGYGGYYAWGEINEKSTYSSYSSSKYNTVDGLTQLEYADDVAHAKWGGKWRMPTSTEFNRLINYCTWTWTTVNGVRGYTVTSNINGNSIFLPAAGYRSGASVGNESSYGYYWAKDLYSGNYSFVNHLYFYSSNKKIDYNYRYYGYPIRPVTD